MSDLTERVARRLSPLTTTIAIRWVIFFAVLLLVVEEAPDAITSGFVVGWCVFAAAEQIIRAMKEDD